MNNHKKTNETKYKNVSIQKIGDFFDSLERQKNDSTDTLSSKKNLPQHSSDISQSPSQCKKFNRLVLLDKIRELAPISQYQFSKKIGLHYPTLINIIRDFEHVGLIETHMELRCSRAVKIIDIPKEEKNE